MGATGSYAGIAVVVREFGAAVRIDVVVVEGWRGAAMGMEDLSSAVSIAGASACLPLELDPPDLPTLCCVTLFGGYKFRPTPAHGNRKPHGIFLS